MIKVIRGVTETVFTSFRLCLNNIPGKHDIKEAQKTAIMDNVHVF
jgi:hypothetical protein